MGEEAGGDLDSPAPQRRYSLSQAIKEERREMRFNRLVSAYNMNIMQSNFIYTTLNTKVLHGD